MRKLWVWILCAALVLSNIHYVPAFAAETDGEGEEVVQEEAPQEEPKEEPKKEEPKKEEPKKEEPKKEPKKEEPKKEEPKKEEPKKEEPKKEEPKQEEPKQEEPKQEEPKQEEPQQEETPVVQESRKLTADRENISFGTINVGDQAEPEFFSIWNDGNVASNISWNQADVEQIFELTAMADANQAVEAGEEMNFQVSLRDNLAAGDYKATIVFQDEADPTVQALVSLTVKVKEKKDQNSKDENLQEGQDAGQGDKGTDQSEDTEKTDQDDKGKGTTEEGSTEDGDIYYIWADADPAGAGFIAGDGFFEKGENAILVAMENEGYRFAGWYLQPDNKKVSDKYEFLVKNIQSDQTYVAKFELQGLKIKVKSQNDKYGKVSGGGEYTYGKKATLKAEPKSGYKFTGWYENGKLVSNKQTFTTGGLKANHTFTAHFKPVQHSVKVSVYPKDAGKVTGGGKYDHDSNVKLQAKANKGYVFKGYSINNKTISEKEAFTLKNVTKDVSIKATFAKDEGKSYEMVSGIANKGGTISPSGKLEISEHGSITYTFAPKNGYAVQEVAVDGKKVGPVKSYTFKDIKENHKISVAFAPIKNSEKDVKKYKIITESEAAKAAVADLYPAGDESDARSSDIITPETYNLMKEEGTLEEALKIPSQDIIGMDDAETLPDKVSDYNYDEASGICQELDITPEEAAKMIEDGDVDALIKAAYETGYLSILLNNQYLVPGNEEEANDIFEDDSTVSNMLEFVKGVLNKEDENQLVAGKKMTVTFGITKGGDFTDEEKKLISESGAKVSEYFHMTVMKQRWGEKAELVTDLSTPVQITLPKPAESDTNCIIRLHDGKAEILEDVGNDPATITIRTDKFSPYAFATMTGKTGSATGSPLPIAAVAAAAILIAAVLVVTTSRRRKKR